jgi:hypothetical protein
MAWGVNMWRGVHGLGFMWLHLTQALASDEGLMKVLCWQRLQSVLATLRSV